MRRHLLPGLLITLFPLLSHAEPAALHDGDRVAIVGDSITEQKLYSVYMEDYLLMCRPKANLQTMQFGWGGETAGGFANRMAQDLLPYKPTVATTCYGMNDGGYVALKPEALQAYIQSMDQIVSAMQAAGVRQIVVGSPGAVDTTTFHVLNTKPEVYNQTLAKFAQAAHALADKHSVAFADVHAVMADVMTQAKAKYGNDYPIARDGVHPEPAGHLVMAYAFLKALGCDGNLGQITVDLAANHATATDGHQILSSADGSVEIQSTRYPFCFTSDDLLKITEFFPFNNDLNRLTLKVTGAGAGKVKITWGTTSKTFDAKDLESGINLPAEFPHNPFLDPFKKTESAIRAQQAFETPMIKTLYHKPATPTTETERATARAHQQDLAQAAAATVTPVKHTIKIEPIH